MSLKYAIIDIETTGGSAGQDRITEIAIIIHDGNSIIDTFESLVNPDCVIPYNITMLTGITQEMVENAPRFHEIARQIVLMTQDCIFVAHNVRFDYGFIKEEFKRLGYAYTRRQLCTVRMSRSSFPGLSSYSLGNLIAYFNISVKDRHRAMADALATTVLLEKILHKPESQSTLKEMLNAGIKESKLPASLTMEEIFELPDECGVYYFHDKNGDVVYVGKSINIQKRVIEHFADTTPKAAKLQQCVHEITYELTGSELIALLLEAREIKRLQPAVNKAQRKFRFPYMTYAFEDNRGYINFGIIKNTAETRKKKWRWISEHASIQEAKSRIGLCQKEYTLCARLCQLESGSNACFYRQIHQCNGACIGEESPEEYNLRAEAAISSMSKMLSGSFALVDKGRTHEERALVIVENGLYCGYGYTDGQIPANDSNSWKEIIQNYPSTPDIQRIIKHYMSAAKGLKMIRYQAV